LEVEGVRGRRRKTWKEIVNKHMDNFHVKKVSDALYCCKWRRMIRGNWSDRSSDSGAKR